MSTVLLILGVIVLGFVVNVVLKQSYNFLFFLGGKPVVWIVIVSAVAVVVWGLSAAFGWGVSVPAWATTIALFMNLPPGQKSAEDESAVSAVADYVYASMGIKHGRLLHRIGLGAFVMFSIASWVVFYGEVCTGNECRSLVGGIF